MKPNKMDIKSRPALPNIAPQPNRNSIPVYVNAKITKRWKVGTPGAWDSFINITSLNVNPLRVKVCKGNIAFKTLRTR